jgi:hypothetical protein
MGTLWRSLPGLILPALIGLAAAYLATGFLPRPAPTLRPPEELRAKGLGYAEESPVRAVLERNVLNLESAPFTPPGPSALSEPPDLPEAGAAPTARAAKPPILPPQAGFAPLEPTVTPSAGQITASAPLSGGPQVKGEAVGPARPGAITVQELPAEAERPAQQTSKTSRNGSRAAQTARGGPEGFRLVGVIAGGERPVAMLQVDGAAVTLKPGEAARGWTLQSVEPGQVTLRRGQEVRRLPLGSK